MSGTKVKYEVYVDDNYDYMDESARSFRGSFDELEEAIASCEQFADARKRAPIGMRNFQ